MSSCLVSLVMMIYSVKCIVYELFRANNTNAEEKDEDDKIIINFEESNRKIKE